MCEGNPASRLAKPGWSAGVERFGEDLETVGGGCPLGGPKAPSAGCERGVSCGSDDLTHSWLCPPALNIDLVSSDLAQLTLVYLQIPLGFICTQSHHLQIMAVLFQYLLQGLGPPTQY